MSEAPVEGTIEDWIIVNPTADTHPIHLYLVQFQLLSRQSVDTKRYMMDWMMMNGGIGPFIETTMELPIKGYLSGQPTGPLAHEQGWKGTVQMHPGQVTMIRVRFAPQDGSSLVYPFDVTSGDGYVWHCHILEHEDNEMMRPYVVVRPTP